MISSKYVSGVHLTSSIVIDCRLTAGDMCRH